jgi:hypothetical protein
MISIRRLISIMAGVVTLLALVCTLLHRPFMEADIARRASLSLALVEGLERVEVRAVNGRDAFSRGASRRNDSSRPLSAR